MSARASIRPPRGSRLAALAAWISLCALGAWLFRATRGTWPDVLIDFGRELYAAWQLSQGADLYRDLAWFSGPLSAYWNAAWFACRGPSLAVLTAVNLGILVLAAVLAWVLAARAAGTLAAWLCGVLFLCAFAFSQQVGVGNYNWVCPYSHEATHGILLGLAALVALQHWGGSRSRGWVALAGACVGLAFLTKPETSLAAAGGGCLTLALLAPRGARRASWVAFALPALGVVLVAIALLATQLGSSDAVRAVFSPWAHVLGGKAGDIAFYRSGMGLDDPAERLRELALWSLAWCAALGSPLLASAWLGRTGERRTASRIAAALLVLAALAAFLLAPSGVRWSAAARPLPVVALGVLMVACLRRGDGSNATQRAVAAGWSALALLALAKMILYTRLIHYGFALALPAALLAVALGAGWIPSLLERRGRNGLPARAVACACVLAAAFGSVRRTLNWVERKPVEIGQGGDGFLADARGAFVREALAEIERGVPADGTLLVLPEGVMLNYLARRASPTPYVNFMPPELALFGEETMLAVLRTRPPSAVLLVHKDTSEYGLPLFGRDYGRALAAWVAERFRPAATWGAQPLVHPQRFGIQLLLPVP